MKKLRIISILSVLTILSAGSIILNIAESKVGYSKNEFNEKSIIRKKNQEPPNFQNPKDDTGWERENAFINDNIYLEQGAGYLIKDHNLISNPNKIKIAIFGDSFMWGNGNTNVYSTIKSTLFQELNSKYKGNIFEVKTYTRNGMSTMSYYDFFLSYDIKEYDPDLIIYYYYNNDSYPEFTESLICKGLPMDSCRENDPKLDPTYQRCMEGYLDPSSILASSLNKNFPSLSSNLLKRYCNKYFLEAEKKKYDINDVMKNPFISPYLETWKKSVNLLKKQLEPYKLAVANAMFVTTHFDVDEKMFQEFEKNNYDIITMKKTKEYFTTKVTDDTGKVSEFYKKDSKTVEDTMINVGNGHSSSFLNNLYAKDVAQYIYKTIPQEKIALAESTQSEKYDNNLVKYTMPVFDVKVSNNENESIIEFNKNFSEKYTQRISGNANLPFQYANCVNLGYSNFEFTLNYTIKDGYIEFEPLSKLEGYELGFYYYNENYKREYMKIDKRLYNSKITLPRTTISNSLILSFPNQSKGCEIKNEITAPDFKFKIKYSK